MAFLDIHNVIIRGLSACVPSKKETIKEIYKWDGCDNFINTTGIKTRRVADSTLTTSDLCMHAAEQLIEELGWKCEEIEALIFVTQTPDYVLPATSCILQDKLKLSKECFTLDISLGCSGWVYGLSVLASMMQSGEIKKGLLLAGDTPLKMCSPEDKSSFPLFGDAGTATALENVLYDECMKFYFNTDGSGADCIILRDGGYRNPVNEQSLITKEQGEGVIRSLMNVELDGMTVFSFGITQAPKSVKRLCEHFQIERDSVDYFTFHQANMMMNEMIRKKLKLPENKVPYSIEEFGNTSSASIPLTLVTKERYNLQSKRLRHIACGFGVGLSWGSVYFETDRIVVPELIEL